MVRSSGTSEATLPSSSSSSSSSSSRPAAYQTARPTHRSTPSTSSTSSGKGAVVAPHVSSDFLERRSSIAQTEHSTDSNRTIRGNRSIDRFSGSTEGASGSSRSNSVDFSTAVVTTTVVTTSSPATALRIRPVLRLRSHSTDTVSQAASVSSSPQRRGNNPLTNSGTNSSITTPSTGNSEGSHFWKSSPQRLRTNPDRIFTSSPIVYPDEDPRAYPEVPSGSQLAPALPPKPPPASSLHPAYTGGKQSREPSGSNLQRGKDPIKARTREHRSHSQKAMLSSALQKANTAVALDNAENYEGAMEAYGDACVLLGQVMMRAGAGEDRRKLQAIQETYTQRVEELRNLSPRPTGIEKELPARPLTEEFTDQESLYPPEDDESTVIISTTAATSVIGNNRYANGVPLATAVPPRRDSLYMGPDLNSNSEPLPPLPIARSRSAEHIPAPFSPGRPPRSPKRDAIIGDDGFNHGLYEGNRESFTFGAAALSPRFSPAKERDYGIRRSVSDASSISSRRSSSHRQSGLSSTNTHSRQGSEASTSWLNTIDESGGSVSGESSPGWTKKKPRKQSDRELRREKEKEIMRQFEEDFDSQLDAAVEAAYDDGYEVDYTYDRDDDEMLMMRSPRMNVERAKERVREVEREMEVEIQKEKERRLERERLGFSDKRRDSDVDFFDDMEGGESDEEERMLEEMTRLYTLDDPELNLDSKTALPRQSASTTYSDSTLPRESGSSGYSSGTTWASSVSSAHMLNGTILTTVTEAPLTPPPPPPTLPPPSLPPQNLPPHPPPPSLPPQVPPPPLPLAPAPPAPSAQKIKEPLPALPNPNIAAIPGLAVTRSSSSVRSRRLSALAEPLKVETSASNAVSSNATAVPTTLVRGPSPQPGAIDSEPPSEPPPLPPVSSPANAPPKSASAASSSRPGTSSDFRDGPLPDPPATAQGISGRKLSSPTPPTPPTLEPPGLSVPLTKTVSDDGASGSPARYTPRITGIPGSLRQIQSSASLKSRNVGSPDTESPGTPHNGLFSSSSTSNLRKAFPRSATPATPTIIPNTPMGAPPTAGLPAGGMHLFDSKLHSPATPGSEDALSSSIPVPLEPCPPEPLSKPFWLMRCFYQTVAHPRGGYISARLFVPREVWLIKGVKIRAVDDKISACDLVSAALAKLATVKHDDIHALYEEMQSLEGVLDRAQAILSKKLGNEVGSVGARSLYQTENTISENNTHDMVTKSTGVTGGKSYFSLRKLRTKTSNTTLSSFGSSSNLSGGDFYGGSGLPMAAGATDSSSQPKRNLEGVTFGGPHAAYISALARLFDAAQILDRLPVFNEDNIPKKTAISTKVGLELSHRHAAEFFGFYICRFVLADVSLLLDKFVKRGSEWVAQ